MSIRITSFVVASLALLAGSVASVAASESRHPPAVAAARSAVQAAGKEFRITLSKRTVKPGSLRVEFVNFGEDDHDLAITRKGTSYTRTMREIRPKERGVLTLNVRRGTYVFWCTLPKHKALGMRSTLRVKR